MCHPQINAPSIQVIKIYKSIGEENLRLCVLPADTLNGYAIQSVMIRKILPSKKPGLRQAAIQ
jgi:hypothetical protein